MITFPCGCGQILKAKPEHIGKSVRCAKCKNVINVPAEMVAKSLAIATNTPPPLPAPSDAPIQRRRAYWIGAGGSLVLLMVAAMIVAASRGSSTSREAQQTGEMPVAKTPAVNGDSRPKAPTDTPPAAVTERAVVRPPEEE